MADSDEGRKRSNGGSSAGGRSTSRGGETLCSVLLYFVATFASLRPALLRRLRSSSAKAVARFREDSRNPARDLLLWTRRRGPLGALFGFSGAERGLCVEENTASFHIIFGMRSSLLTAYDRLNPVK
ncbi:hypothetical protein B296_00050555 [Ensete ventricosum]|uniref:Uncharacterized protein n=1 Tax=Ensete ventricosum TaxID=4639 RepID=A0A426Y0I7_ENSVE|nr:hypothetical protein B296_00050555 [Ensete ventricosum]